MLPSLVNSMLFIIALCGAALALYCEHHINRMHKGSCQRLKLAYWAKGVGGLLWIFTWNLELAGFIGGMVLIVAGLALKRVADRGGCDMFGCEE